MKYKLNNEKNLYSKKTRKNCDLSHEIGMNQ
jgi:hypothetical protein